MIKFNEKVLKLSGIQIVQDVYYGMTLSKINATGHFFKINTEILFITPLHVLFQNLCVKCFSLTLTFLTACMLC